ncbi:ribosomal protein S8 [Cyathus striatus]|nr:ribosomal protein S8 [Cyathus striatus]
MVRISVLNDCLNNIVNAERRGKRNKVVVKFLSVMQRHGMLHGEFELIDDHRSGKIVIQLNGRLNKCGVISPRFNIQHNQMRTGLICYFLLGTTSSGILDHEEARRKMLVGRF